MLIGGHAKKYCELIRKRHVEITNEGSGYTPDALGCVLKVLNEAVTDSAPSESIREKVTYAAANLLASDYVNEWGVLTHQLR